MHGLVESVESHHHHQGLGAVIVVWPYIKRERLCRSGLAGCYELEFVKYMGQLQTAENDFGARSDLMKPPGTWKGSKVRPTSSRVEWGYFQTSSKRLNEVSENTKMCLCCSKLVQDHIHTTTALSLSLALSRSLSSLFLALALASTGRRSPQK